MDIIEALNNRYSTKEFDPTKKLTDEQLEKVKALLQLSPSSTNIQPWHFVLATTDEGKKRISKSTQGFFSFNEKKVLDASAVVVFAAKTQLTEEYLNNVLDKEDEDGRYAKPELKKDGAAGRKVFVDVHKYDSKDLQHWNEKQVYLNAGNFLMGLAELGIDAVPMEGFDSKVLDEEFNLREKDFSSVLIVPIGYRSDTDFNAKLPKSRLSLDEIITSI